ncbi:hypothetical protein G5I_00071 [Acromyrmex echinatior]|uniref:Uncharacterized protein n=1 Tax=Acromyrmex echinatior TaxID=103372 RepID=F4W3X0_ACREC|nr:hypothetical protein G5I_00071 [Acromyrmex echinatior]
MQHIAGCICQCDDSYDNAQNVHDSDWHRSRREEKKNPLSRYLFSTHVASIGRDLAGYNRQRDYYWLRLSGTCGNDIPFSGSDFRAPKTARHAVACVGRAFSIWIDDGARSTHIERHAFIGVVTFAPDLSQPPSSGDGERPTRLKRSHLDEKAVERVLDTRSRYTTIIAIRVLRERQRSSKYLTRECLRSINAECRADSPGMHSIASYQIDIEFVQCSRSSPWSLPVSSFVGLARCFGDTRPVAHARPGKDPRVTLAVVVELVRGEKKSRGSAAGKARAFDRRA